MKIDVRGLTKEQQAQIVRDMYMCSKQSNTHPLQRLKEAFLGEGEISMAHSASSLQEQDISIADVLSSATFSRGDPKAPIIMVDRLQDALIKTSVCVRGGVAHLDFRCFERDNGASAVQSVYAKLVQHTFLKGRIFAVDPDKELRAAAKEGNLAEVKMLVENDEANPNAVAKNGRTALHFAVSNNHPKVVEYLVPKTDCTIEDREGKSPFAIAQALGVEAIIDVLTPADAEPAEGVVVIGNDDADGGVDSIDGS